jgi:hypothetical protein
MKMKLSQKKVEQKTFDLPTERNVPSDALSDYSILLYGAKKIGKTSVASHFPDALFLATEPGTKALEVFSVDITSWGDFLGYIKTLETAPKKKFSTIVVDTVDLAYEICLQSVCKKEGWEHPSDEKYGKGWKKISDAFRSAILRLFHLPGSPGIIFISHDTEKEFEDREGNTFERVQPTMPKQALNVVEALVDIIISYQYDGARRVAKICGDETIVAGCRLEHRFRTTSGERVSCIPMGTSSEQSFKNFIRAFDNQQTTIDGRKPAEEAPKKKMILKK